MNADVIVGFFQLVVAAAFVITWVFIVIDGYR
jgi:hypothetical protein